MSNLVPNAGVSLNIKCDSPVNIAGWLVEANGVKPVSSNYCGLYTTFQATNVPFNSASPWAKVALDGKDPKFSDTQSNTHWGIYQPATADELHFAVSSAGGPSPGVFPVPVHLVTNVYGYDPAGQLTSKTQSDTGVSPVSYAYDSARNLTRCWSGTTFTNFHQYDHARRRVMEIRATSAGTTTNRFIYDGMDVIAKLDETTGEMVYFNRGL